MEIIVFGKQITENQSKKNFCELLWVVVVKPQPIFESRKNQAANMIEKAANDQRRGEPKTISTDKTSFPVTICVFMQGLMTQFLTSKLWKMILLSDS